MIVRREIRKRGFFGWLFLLLFFGFNLLMMLWLFSYWSTLSGTTASSEAARVGKTIGGTIGSSIIAVVWCAGAVILGLLALLTRGSRIIVEEFERGRDLDRRDDSALMQNIEKRRREPRF